MEFPVIGGCARQPCWPSDLISIDVPHFNQDLEFPWETLRREFGRDRGAVDAAGI